MNATPGASELIIAAITVIGLGWLVIKEYYPQAILTIAGMLLYLTAHWLGGIPIIKETTGLAILDVIIKLKDLFVNRSGGLGLLIMSVVGFSHYMSHIGASQALVKISVKPVSKIKNPWVVLAASYIIGIVVGLFITSATGLGLLLMVTLYPIMRSAGISKASAVGVIITTQSFEIGVVQSNVIRASEAIKMDVATYFTSYQLTIAIIMVVVTMFTHVWWQRRCDTKEGWFPHEHLNESDEIETKESFDAPSWYAIFPLIPFFLLVLFSKLVLGNPSFISWIKTIWAGYPLKTGEMDVIVSMLIPTFVAMTIHMIRIRSFKKACAGYKVFAEGMGSAFASIVVLLVAAQFFADALKDMGAINAFLDFAGSLGVGGIGMILVTTGLIVFASMIMGSGNASFMSFAEIAPSVATKFGISPISIMLPMQMGSSIGRTMSPITAVVVACAGVANMSSAKAAKRASVPMIASLITCVTLSIMMYSSH